MDIKRFCELAKIYNLGLQEGTMTDEELKYFESVLYSSPTELAELEREAEIGRATKKAYQFGHSIVDSEVELWDIEQLLEWAKGVE